MAFTDINSEDRLVQATFAEHLKKALGWESVYAWNDETFGPVGTLGRADTREVVLTRADHRSVVAAHRLDDLQRVGRANHRLRISVVVGS